MILKDKVILITGGAKGIGLSTAIRLSSDNKVIVIDKDGNACDELKKNNINVYNEDITNYKKMEKILNDIYKLYTNVDILINNAAIQTVTNISKLSFDDWTNVIETNLNANFYITQFISNRMIKGNSILNIISTHYNKPRVNKLNYDVSKAGVALLTKGYAIELAERGITINALAIGATYTPMNNDFNLNPELEYEAKLKIPLKHISTSEEVADFIYNIISNFSDVTTGSIFTIDGGRSLL